MPDAVVTATVVGGAAVVVAPADVVPGGVAASVVVAAAVVVAPVTVVPGAVVTATVVGGAAVVVAQVITWANISYQFY